MAERANCELCNCLSCIEKCTLNEQERSVFVQNRQYIEYARGETVFKQGVYSDYVVFVKNGLLKLHIEGEKGRTYIVTLLAKDDMAGISDFDTDTMSEYTLTALKKTQVCLLKKSVLKQLYFSNNCIMRNILRRMNNQQRDFIEQLKILSTKQVHGRFAMSLLYLNAKQFQSEQVYNHLTRRELAELSGISLDSVTKLINELRHDKIIEMDGKKISIRDYEMVRRLSKIG